MDDQLSCITLPSGLTLHIVSKVDAELEYHANTSSQVYFGNGQITLKPGDTVLDIGANVGSFARIAAAAVGPTGTIVCMEPIPLVHRALEMNLQAYKRWAGSKKLGVPRMIAIAAAAGAIPSSKALLTYYPHCAALSTQYPDVPDVLQATSSLVRYSPDCYSWLQRLGKVVCRLAPRLYALIHAAVFPAVYLKGAQQLSCEVKTISQVIQEQGLRCVDLLKMNVERAEMDVLRGVDAQHWRMVRQVSAQVHDIKGRVEAMRKLLEDAGFERIEVYKEPRFRGCCLFMVYASRLDRKS